VRGASPHPQLPLLPHPAHHAASVRLEHERLGVLYVNAMRSHHFTDHDVSLLETLASQTGFYMARELMAKQDHRRALAALSVATEAAPSRPLHWYNLACAQARVGARRQALDSLERAVAAGFEDRVRMAADEDLASLREDVRFQALVQGGARGALSPP